MKTLIIKTLLIYLSVVFFSGCENETLTQDNTILLDQTEEYFNYITQEQFIGISAAGISKNYGEHTRILSITESGFPTVTEFDIDPVKIPILGNEYNRRGEVQEYLSKINFALVNADSGKNEREGSVIIKVLIYELNRLSQSSSDIRKLICVTDGMENSALLDFYNNSTFKLLQSDPDNMQTHILKSYSLNDLHGIEIYFIYTPLNRADSERFEIISNFYKELFESFGATVIISGSL